MSYNKEINLALKDFSIGNKEKAYKKLKNIFYKNKDNDQLRFNLAVVAQSLNYNDEAKNNYRFLIDKNNNFKSMINLYLLYIKERNYLDALEIINKLTNTEKNAVSIIKDKAFVLYKLKKYNESISICENYLKNNTDVNFLNILGLNFFSMNNFK